MKKVIVTGGSRGIGAECVRTFSKNGYEVSFIYNNSDLEAKKLEEETGACAYKCDVKNIAHLETTLNEAIERMGGVDVLVNNAGIALVKLFGDTTNEDIENVFSTNLIGATVAARTVSKHMIKEHYGRIINIGSVWGKVGASMEVVYSASKAGLEGLTKALAKELGPSGITVNCIEPGVIDTEMNGCLEGDTLVSLVNETPLCRIGRTSDIASAVLWLASEDASFVTAQILGVDGGFGL